MPIKTPSQNTALYPIFLSLMGFTLYSLCDFCGKELGGRYHAAQLSLVIAAGTQACVLFYLLFAKTWKSEIRSKARRLQLLRGALFTVTALCNLTALPRLQFAEFYTFAFTVPFFAALLSWFLFDEKIDLPIGIATFIGFLGILIALNPSLHSINTWGLLVVVGVFFFSLSVVLSKRIPESEPTLCFLFYPTWSYMVILFPIAWLKGFQPIALTDIPLFILASGTNGLGLILVSRGFQLGKGASVAPFQYVQMLWGIILGYWFFQEIPGARSLIGAAIIIGSGYFIMRHSLPGKPSPDFCEGTEEETLPTSSSKLESKC